MGPSIVIRVEHPSCSIELPDLPEQMTSDRMAIGETKDRRMVSEDRERERRRFRYEDRTTGESEEEPLRYKERAVRFYYTEQACIQKRSGSEDTCRSLRMKMAISATHCLLNPCSSCALSRRLFDPSRPFCAAMAPFQTSRGFFNVVSRFPRAVSNGSLTERARR